MTFIVENEFWPLFVSLNVLKMLGFLVPGSHSKSTTIFLKFYWFFWFMFIQGIYVIVQLGDLIQIWGDLTLMVDTLFLLLTMVVCGAKVIVVWWRGAALQKIVDEGAADTKACRGEEERRIIGEYHRGIIFLSGSFAVLTVVTVLGWIASAEKGSMLLRAWYPYDTNRSPAFEITYAHQASAIILSGALNVSMDSLISSLIGQCSCRLKLTALALRTLCDDFGSTLKKLDANQERLVASRIREAVIRHQAALRSAGELEACFSEPILAQFAVSTVIICVTAYQIAGELQEPHINVIHLIAMTAYQLGMLIQVFMYCYNGDQLTLESSEICTAVYESQWYNCSVRLQRALLLVMKRARRPFVISAGGLAELSLVTYAAIIKASYTFFTVLQNVDASK